MVNNIFLLTFILAHLIGDFVLQTDKIAKEKATSIKGIFIHSIIVLCVQIVFLSVFGFKGLLAGLMSGGIHFFIDYTKYFLNKRKVLKDKQILLFILDQAVHILLIILITHILGREYNNIYSKYIEYVEYGIQIIILAYVAPIASKTLIFDMKLIINTNNFFIKYERGFDRIIIFILWGMLNFIDFNITIPLIVALFYIYKELEERYFKYNLPVAFIKYTVYSIILMFVV